MSAPTATEVARAVAAGAGPDVLHRLRCEAGGDRTPFGVLDVAGSASRPPVADGTERVVVATDGTSWRVWACTPDAVLELAPLDATPRDPHGLALRLECFLPGEGPRDATHERVCAHFGPDGPLGSFLLAALRRLLARSAAHPEIAARRARWNETMRDLYGGEPPHGDELFVRHAALVLLATLVGIRALAGPEALADGEPRDLARGGPLARTGIANASAGDPFDWPLPVRDPVVETAIRAVARGLALLRFDDAGADPLAALYEATIDTELRHRLGEHYTPDWLAARVCARAVRDPLRERVVDPACGAGTFLFHAVRRVLDEAARRGLDPAEAVRLAAANVRGLDVHPVAVATARAVFLLALAPALARGARPPARLPVDVADLLDGYGDLFDPVASGRADVVVGNPPWLRYSATRGRMRERFRIHAGRLGLWAGGVRTTATDVSGCFLALAMERHLRPGGTLAFVAPYATLSRAPYAPLRSGRLRLASGTFPAFEEVWDLSGVRPLFPLPACVLFVRASSEPSPLSRLREATRFEGVLPRRHVAPAEAERLLSTGRSPLPPAIDGEAASPYAREVRAGATLFPRRLVLLDEARPAGEGRVLVRPRRGSADKPPWSEVEPPEGPSSPPSCAG